MIYSLRLFQPVLVGSALVYPFGPDVLWRRSIRSMGGFWQGGLSLTGEPAFLMDAFYTWLGGHLKETSAGVTSWEGLVYELEFTHNGIVRRRSLDQMFNAVDIEYQTDAEVTNAGYTTQAQSIARYGRREQRLTADNVPSATATGYRDTFLAGHAWPWARPVTIGPPGAAVLEVKACGYVFTANWMYAAAGDGTDHDVDHWISALVGTATGLSSDHGGAVAGAGDCEFLQAGNLSSNTLQVPEVLDSDIRAWAKISELAALGDANGDPWRAWVHTGRRLHYAEADLGVRYHLRDGAIYQKAAGQVAVNPWLMGPGVIRDMSYPVGRAERGGMLTDARDLYIEEVEIGNDGTIALKTATFDEAGLVAAQSELLAERIAMAEAVAAEGEA